MSVQCPNVHTLGHGGETSTTAQSAIGSPPPSLRSRSEERRISPGGRVWRTVCGRGNGTLVMGRQALCALAIQPIVRDTAGGPPVSRVRSCERLPRWANPSRRGRCQNVGVRSSGQLGKGGRVDSCSPQCFGKDRRGTSGRAGASKVRSNSCLFAVRVDPCGYLIWVSGPISQGGVNLCPGHSRILGEHGCWIRLIRQILDPHHHFP